MQVHVYTSNVDSCITICHNIDINLFMIVNTTTE